MDKSLLLRATVTGVDALLCLNGMVLCKLRCGQEIRLPVHEFIQSGENRIQLLALGFALVDFKVQVCVELQKDRGITALVQPQVLYEFSKTIRRGECLEKNRLIDVCVDLPVSFPRWRYLDVMQSCSASDDTQKIRGFLLNLLNLLQAKNLAALQPFFSVRNREIAAAYGLEMQEVHSSFQAHLHKLSSQATLLDSVWNPVTWRLHPVCEPGEETGPAIYAVLNAQYEPLLQFQMSDNSSTFQWPMHVGVLGGEVFVLR